MRIRMPQRTITLALVLAGLVLASSATQAGATNSSEAAETVLEAAAARTLAAAPPKVAGGYGSVSPYRVLDTRFGTGAPVGPVAPGATLQLTVAGKGGVPSSGVSAVVLNVTVDRPTAGGWITAFPFGSAQPTASNLNFNAGQTVPNLVVVQVGVSGRISLYNGSPGTTHLIADIAGYYLGGAPSQPGTFAPVPVQRVLDTRNGTGGPIGPATPGGTVSPKVTGVGGVPASGISAVIVNVTVVNPSSGGWITAYASGAPAPNASNLNFEPGQTVPNLVVAPVGANGRIALYNGSAGNTHLIVDIAGYFLAGTPELLGSFGSVPPGRVLDTRLGTGSPAAFVGPQGSVTFVVAGAGGVPATGVSAVVLNVTVTGPSQPGWITAHGSGSALPNASNLNFVAGQTVPNLVTVPVGADGKVTLYNGSGGVLHLIADVAGYYRNSDVFSSGAVLTDSDGNGILDRARWDFGDGTWQSLEDVNGDGTADVLFIDVNGDEVAEVAIVDNDDGTYTVYQDTDGDGTYDSQQTFSRAELDETLPGVADLLDLTFGPVNG